MTGSEVNAVIDHLADKLAIPAGKMMELLPAIGIKSVTMTVAGLIGVVVGGLLSLWGAWVEDEFFKILLITSGCCMAIICTIVFMVNLTDMVIWLSNPQAWALNYLLGIMTGGK